MTTKEMLESICCQVASQLWFGHAEEAQNIIVGKLIFRDGKSMEDVSKALFKVKQVRVGFAKTELELDTLTHLLTKVFKLKVFFFYSCKFGRPETLKRHKKYADALKAVKDSGLVYCEETDRVFQSFSMSNGSVRGFDTASQAEKCDNVDFDIRGLVKGANVERAVR